MFEKIRQLMEKPAWRYAFVGLFAVVILYAVWSVIGFFGTDPIVAAANRRTFIDSQTGKTFDVTLPGPSSYPCVTPAGTKTGYPAEPCFWTKDGTGKSDPTWVFVKEYAGIHEPTFCPDCGRLVTEMNAPAIPGHKPPPTKAELTHAR